MLTSHLEQDTVRYIPHITNKTSASETSINPETLHAQKGAGRALPFSMGIQDYNLKFITHTNKKNEETGTWWLPCEEVRMREMNRRDGSGIFLTFRTMLVFSK